MHGRDSLNILNQDLHDWEYAGLNVTEEFKKKYKAEFDEIKAMSKSKTKNNAPIAKTAFEEKSLDKDQ
jgi:3-mercaptopyruvate sulfurtransferase SseA